MRISVQINFFDLILKTRKLEFKLHENKFSVLDFHYKSILVC